jgi:hypothetical protein
VVYVKRERTLLEQEAAFEEDVVAEVLGSADADFDAVVGGVEVVAGLSGGCEGRCQRCEE